MAGKERDINCEGVFLPLGAMTRLTNTMYKGRCLDRFYRRWMVFADPLG